MQAAGSMYRIEIFQETFLGTSGNRRTFVCLLILCLLRYHKTAFSCFVSNYTEDFSQGVMVSCNGVFFLMLSVVKCRQITSTVINYHVGWTTSRYVT